MENQPLWCCFEGFVLRLRLLIASVPGLPAGRRDWACLQLDLVVRCSSAGGAEFRVLASWGPLLVPGSLYSPATEILLFFLGSFKVVDEGFLPPTAGRSFIGGTSACSGPLLRVTAISGLRAGDWGIPLRRRVHARVWWSPVFPSFGSGGRRRLVYPLCLVHRPEFISGQYWPLLDFPVCGISAGLCRSSLASPSRCLSESAPSFHRLISPCCGCVWLKESSLTIFLEVMTRHGFHAVPGHRHCHPCRASPPFLGHSMFHRWWRPSLFGKH